MEKNFLTLFLLSLISSVLLISILVVLLVFCKKILRKKNYKLILLFVFTAFLLLNTGERLIACCRDYSYYSTQSCEEAVGKVVSFAYVKDDEDGNGALILSNPVFLIQETGEKIILHTKNVTIGKTYHIRYYPHTKICEVYPIS